MEKGSDDRFSDDVDHGAHHSRTQQDQEKEQRPGLQAAKDESSVLTATQVSFSTTKTNAGDAESGSEIESETLLNDDELVVMTKPNSTMLKRHPSSHSFNLHMSISSGFSGGSASSLYHDTAGPGGTGEGSGAGSGGANAATRPSIFGIHLGHLNGNNHQPKKLMTCSWSNVTVESRIGAGAFAMVLEVSYQKSKAKNRLPGGLRSSGKFRGSSSSMNAVAIATEFGTASVGGATFAVPNAPDVVMPPSPSHSSTRRKYRASSLRGSSSSMSIASHGGTGGGSHHFKKLWALKCIKEGDLDSDAIDIARQDLAEEARLLSLLPAHPHIIQIRGLGRSLALDQVFEDRYCDDEGWSNDDQDESNEQESYFFLMDMLDGTLQTRLDGWRKYVKKNRQNSISKFFTASFRSASRSFRSTGSDQAQPTTKPPRENSPPDRVGPLKFFSPQRWLPGSFRRTSQRQQQTNSGKGGDGSSSNDMSQAPPSLYHRIRKIAYPIARALNTIHQQNIVHCDIKPNNIGFDFKTGRVKLFDFGLSQDLNLLVEPPPAVVSTAAATATAGGGPVAEYGNDPEPADDQEKTTTATATPGKDKEKANEDEFIHNHQNCASGGEQTRVVVGTYRYMSPEVLQAQPITTAADVYSFGIVLWELSTLQFPHVGVRKPAEIYQRVVTDEVRPSLDDKDHPYNCIPLPLSLRTLLHECWDPNPSKRPNFSKIVKCLMRIMQDIKRDEHEQQKQLKQMQRKRRTRSSKGRFLRKQRSNITISNTSRWRNVHGTMTAQRTASLHNLVTPSESEKKSTDDGRITNNKNRLAISTSASKSQINTPALPAVASAATRSRNNIVDHDDVKKKKEEPKLVPSPPKTGRRRRHTIRFWKKESSLSTTNSMTAEEDDMATFEFKFRHEQ